MFGLLGVGPDGEATHRATHVYSMRQAIEEGFILDVLRSYTTYATYFRLENAGLDDPEVDKRQLITAFGEAATSQVSVTVHHVDGHDLARVHAEASSFPVLHDAKGPDGVAVRTLFVRLGNGTRAVTDPAEIDRYIGMRWPAAPG